MSKNLGGSLVIIIAFIFLFSIISYNEFSADTERHKSYLEPDREARQPDDTYAYSSDVNGNIVSDSALQAQTVYR